jgi:phosphate uptake regulator
MKRKIVQHGSSSLTVTLPVKWVKKFNMKKGDELEVVESGPVLTVTTGSEISMPKKRVSTTESGIFTKNNLSHLYQLGYDEIEISFDDPKTLDEIKQRLPDCIGFEIIDQKPNKVLIKSIATTLETEFDTLLRKAFMIANEMAKDMIGAFEKESYGKLKEIRSMESLNNKFTDVCIRILNKKGYKAPKRTMQVYEIVKNIERIADEFKYICDLNKKISSEELRSFKQAVEYYLAFYEMFYKFDAKLKKKLYDERNSLVKIFSEQIEKSKNPLFLHHCINIVMKAFDGAGGYFALVL